MTEISEKVKKCRSCRAPEQQMSLVLDLGPQFLTGFPKPEEIWVGWPKGSLRLVQCASCGLLQLDRTFSRELLYSWYGYRSGTNQSMRDALEDVVKEAVRFVGGLSAGDVVADIGANDGTLLSFYDRGVHRLAIEPCGNLIGELSGHCETLWNIFFDEKTPRALTSRFRGKCKIVTAIAMFYDLDDPQGFLRACSELMDPEGVLVVQMNDLSSMVSPRANAYDNISHEHACYYSLTTFANCAHGAGLKVVSVSFNDVNGGSFRAYCCKSASSRMPDHSVSDAVLRTATLDEELKGFCKRVRSVIDIGSSLVSACAAHGPVYIYGASTRGLVTLQAMGVDRRQIRGAAERSEHKWGRLYSGTGIECVPEDQARKLAKYFLVLPWQFMKEFLAREHDFLGAGGRMIALLPYPRVYWWDGERGVRSFEWEVR